MSDVLLETTAEGEQLKLAAAGAWVAENAQSLEAQIDAATRSGGAVKSVDIDMGRIERLDRYLSARLLQRLTRPLPRAAAITKATGRKENIARRWARCMASSGKPALACCSGMELVPRFASVATPSSRSANCSKAFVNMVGAVATNCRASSRYRAGPASPRRRDQLEQRRWRVVPIIMPTTV